MSDSMAMEAMNQTIFREMNEWSEDENDGRLGTTPRMNGYLCECSDRRCTEPISLTREEYESVRAVPIRFAIALNHENPEIDRVLFEGERFATVEMAYREGAKIARASDPRR